jgi:hypothetical protein
MHMYRDPRIMAKFQRMGGPDAGPVAAGTSLCMDAGVETGAPWRAVSTGRSSSLSPLPTPFFLAK